MPKLRVTLVRSPIGFPEVQKRTVRALGLGRLNKTVELPDNPQIRGMIWAVRHLVKTQTVETPDVEADQTGAHEEPVASTAPQEEATDADT